MSGKVVQLQRVFRRSFDWTSRELAEFYRVEAALIQAGLRVETERGLSDEDDPWFAFCRPDDGEVIVHIARIGSLYILAGPSYDGVASGSDIAALVRDLVNRHPLIQLGGNNRGQTSKIFLHPAAILIAVVATAFFKSTEARALCDDSKAPGDGRGAGGAVALRSDNTLALESHKTIVMDAAQTAVILSAVAAVLQAPVAAASSDEVTRSDAVSSDLLDFTTLPASSEHLAIAVFGAASFHSDFIQDVHPVNGSSFVVNAAAHMGLAEAVPLIAVLWDLQANRLETKADPSHQAEGAPVTIPTGIGPAPAPMHAPVVTLKVGPPADTTEMPVVQTANVSFPSTHTTIETTNAKPEQLPAALVSALNDATHNTIDGELAGLPNESFADSLYSSLKHDTADSASLGPPTATPQPQQLPSTQPVNASVTPGSPPEVSSQDSKAHTPAEVTAAVQDFFSHTPHSKMVNDGSAVIVYDTDALNLRPTELKSVSFDFSDGSTLSLVGLPAELPHHLPGH